MKKILFITLLLSISIVSYSQSPDKYVNYQLEDRFIYDKYIAYIYDKINLPTEQLVIETAKFFIDVPYVGHTLEIEPETLVVNFRELDCTTFVENVFSLTMTVKSRNLSFENFCNILRWVRYRGGLINDYTDRLHYTSDWIFENQRKGFLKDVSKKAGGEKLSLNMYVMSSNTDRYKQLKGEEDLIKKVKITEQQINLRKHFYIPTERINSRFKKIKSGDMVGLVTTLPGIDISHVGIIYKDGDKLTFIHASSTQKKVVINQASLYDYLNNSTINTGIVLSRLR